MSNCNTCFHWRHRAGDWGTCDNRKGVLLTEAKAQLSTHRTFSCVAYSLRFGLPSKPVDVPKPAAGFAQTDVHKEQRAVGRRRVALAPDSGPSNDFDQGGAVTPVRIN